MYVLKGTDWKRYDGDPEPFPEPPPYCKRISAVPPTLEESYRYCPINNHLKRYPVPSRVYGNAAISYIIRVSPLFLIYHYREQVFRGVTLSSSVLQERSPTVEELSTGIYCASSTPQLIAI